MEQKHLILTTAPSCHFWESWGSVGLVFSGVALSKVGCRDPTETIQHVHPDIAKVSAANRCRIFHRQTRLPDISPKTYLERGTWEEGSIAGPGPHHLLSTVSSLDEEPSRMQEGSGPALPKLQDLQSKPWISESLNFLHCPGSRPRSWSRWRKEHVFGQYQSLPRSIHDMIPP